MFNALANDIQDAVIVFWLRYFVVALLKHTHASQHGKSGETMTKLGEKKKPIKNCLNGYEH